MRRSEQMHVLGFCFVADEGDNSPIPIVYQTASSFLVEFPQHAVFWTFFIFKLTADANPFILVGIVFLFYTMQQEILPVLNHITKRRIFHDS